MQGRILRGRAWNGAALGLLATGLLAGCGGGSAATSTSTTVPGSPAASAQQGSAAPADAVVSISGTTPITRASYEHWLAVERALGVSSNSSHQTLGFLITSDWILAEAAARKISVSEAEIKQRLVQIERKSFPRAGALQKFLAKSGESQADLLARVKVELLTARIAAQVAAGKSGAQRSAVLASFQRAFHDHWKAYTSCKAGYLMEDCSKYTGKPEDLTAKSPSSH
jgi:hypothetical protein